MNINIHINITIYIKINLNQQPFGFEYRPVSNETKIFNYFGAEIEVRLLFRASIDVDGDGDISKEEFVKNAMGSKFINDIINKQNN